MNVPLQTVNETFGTEILKIQRGLNPYLISRIVQKQPPEAFFLKKMYLKSSENSQQSTCLGVSFLIKLRN